MTMIDVRPLSGAKVITLQGELNASTSGATYDQIAPLVGTGDDVLLDMSQVRYMSSAGIRTLLLLYRQIQQGGGRVVLVGLSEDLADTLSITGFLEFFTTSPTVDGGLRALQN